MVLVVVLELLGADGLAEVEGEGVEHVLLGVGEGPAKTGDGTDA